MTNNKVFVGIIAVLVAVGAYAIFFRNTESPSVGAASGTEFSNRISLNGGFSAGGAVATTTTAATHTTAAIDFRAAPTVYSWLPNVNTTVSISGTSTQSLIPNVGDVAELYFRNASSTAGATITFAAVDTGVDMQFAEATGGDLVLNGLDWAKVTFIKTSANLVTVIFDEMTEAD